MAFTDDGLLGQGECKWGEFVCASVPASLPGVSVGGRAGVVGGRYWVGWGGGWGRARSWCVCELVCKGG